jgi:hypothetical protein
VWKLRIIPNPTPTAPDLLAALKEAKRRLAQAGMDWLGKGPDPLATAIAKAEERMP